MKQAVKGLKLYFADPEDVIFRILQTVLFRYWAGAGIAEAAFGRRELKWADPERRGWGCAGIEAVFLKSAYFSDHDNRISCIL